MAEWRSECGVMCLPQPITRVRRATIRARRKVLPSAVAGPQRQVGAVRGPGGGGAVAGEEAVNKLDEIRSGLVHRMILG